MRQSDWPKPCAGCIYFHPERDRRPCSILSGGECITAERCSVRDPAPVAIWVARAEAAERAAIHVEPNH